MGIWKNRVPRERQTVKAKVMRFQRRTKTLRRNCTRAIPVVESGCILPVS